MQFFASSQSPWSNSKQPLASLPRPSVVANGGVNRKLDCGWYDSSFDLAQGLEVVEQDCSTLYQLWELSQH